MRRANAALLLLVGCFTAHALADAQFKFPEQTLTVPEGFEVELIAGPELVNRPISASFDEQGRLYVTDSSGSNDKPDVQLLQKPHRIVRLEDTNSDGVFDKAVVFADKMMFPEGCLWHRGSLYVSAPPSIWRLTDTNGDGVADIREEWHQGKTLTGCANDLHGPYLGPDGMIYWCKGAFAEQTYEIRGGKQFSTRAAHIFRAWPDHSGLEPVLTGGMDNPVGVTFTDDGERFLCGTFFVTHEPGHRDGIIHSIYGGVYGKINNVTDPFPKTGDLMPIMTHMGPAAPCSVISYKSDVFGPEYRHNLFLCSFNLHKVTRHVLEPDGATFKTKDSDFLTSDNPDFHPTDVIEDADGSLIVLNTGGWYKICCPTSQLSKPDVLGSIYRIRRKGAPKIDDPRGLKIVWGMAPEKLAELLGDKRVYVARRAIDELALRGGDSFSALQDFPRSDASTDARINAIWALTRINGPQAAAAVVKFLNDKDEQVRSAALHSLALNAYPQLEQIVVPFLEDTNPQMRRIAAEALGRMGKKEAVPALLKALSTKQDRVLEHSLIYALIQIDDAIGTAAGLKAESVNLEKSALIALDQMENGGLDAKAVSSFLASKDKALRETALWVAEHHPNWAGGLVGFFKEQLATANGGEWEALENELAVFAHDPAIQTFIADSFQTGGRSDVEEVMLLKVMADAGIKDCPASWPGIVRAALKSPDEDVSRQAARTAKALAQAKTNTPKFGGALLAIARDESKPPALRLEALASINGPLHSIGSDLFQFLVANVESSKPLTTRNAAVAALDRATLSTNQLLSLTEVMKSAGPLELAKLVNAFERSTNETVGLKLIAGLKDARGLSSVRPDALKTVLAKYPASVQDAARPVFATLNADAAKQGAHIDELLKQLKNGDIRRGQAIFNSPRAGCSTCHTIGYLGGKVGPDLTTIGTVRTERDLLESVVYPSASFVRSYEPYVVMTKNDESYVGVMKKDASDEIVMATGPTTEVRLARADITDIRPGTVSIMPQGFEQQLSAQDLSDLVTFLKSTKWGPK